MSNLTFANLQSEVYAHTGLDSTDATNQANVTRWLTYVQQDICARWPWTFMEGEEAITTISDYTTGTVAVLAGGTSVVGSGTSFNTSAIGTTGQYYIQFSGFNDWYQIANCTTGVNVNLTVPYAQSTNFSGSYTIRKFFYSLSSAADRIMDIVNWNTPLKLVEIDARTLDYLQPNPQSTNSSYAYVTWGYDTSGNIQISPYPFPSDNRLLQVRTHLRPVDGSVSIPNKYAHIIAYGAISIGYAFLRKWEGAKLWDAKFEERLKAMKSEYRMSDDLQLIMRPIDAVQRSNNWISFPSNYPAIAGN